MRIGKRERIAASLEDSSSLRRPSATMYFSARRMGRPKDSVREGE